MAEAIYLDFQIESNEARTSLQDPDPKLVPAVYTTICNCFMEHLNLSQFQNKFNTKQGA